MLYEAFPTSRISPLLLIRPLLYPNCTFNENSWPLPEHGGCLVLLIGTYQFTVRFVVKLILGMTIMYLCYVFGFFSELGHSNYALIFLLVWNGDGEVTYRFSTSLELHGCIMHY